MRYISPKYEKMNIEVENILSASSEVEEEEQVKVENVADGVADFIINASNLFKPKK